jgi:hypothetical protein
MQLFFKMVSDLESFPESWGPNSTVLFINDFLAYEKEGNNGEDESEEEGESTAVAIKNSTMHFDADDLPKFLRWPEFDYWKGFVKLRTEK